MAFLNECLPNKVEESLTAGEPKAVSGCQLSASICNDSDMFMAQLGEWEKNLAFSRR